MAPKQYHIVSHWRVWGTAEEVFDILARPEELPRWWPSAYSDALPIQSGDETGAAKVVRLESRGFLPYLMRWHVVATEVEPPHRLVNRAWGDFEGVCAWTLSQDGAWTDIECDWHLSPRLPLAAVLSPLVKPLYVANLRWAMAKGEESLDIELMRRRANEVERGLVSTPPAGINRSTWAVGFGAGALLALVLLRGERSEKL